MLGNTEKSTVDVVHRLPYAATAAAADDDGYAC